MTDLEWLQQISEADAAATAQTRNVVETPMFRLLLDPHDVFGGVNWATPLKSGAGQDRPGRNEIAVMVRAFEAHNRTPRLEFLAECWPGLAAALEDAGFSPEGDPQEIMIVTPGEFRAASADGVSMRFLRPGDSDETYAVYLQIQTAGFGYGGSEAPGSVRISGWREQIQRGRQAALGLLAGLPVGVGTTLGSGLSEIQGVTTLPDARRRGVAATLSSALVANVFSQGSKAVWLSAEDTAARACYAKIGLRIIGSRLNYSVSR